MGADALFAPTRLALYLISLVNNPRTRRVARSLPNPDNYHPRMLLTGNGLRL